MAREYHLYLKDDTSNETLNESREGFGYSGQDMYYIVNTDTGAIELVQSDRTRPFLNCSLEECAKKHIQQIEDSEKQAEINAKIEQDEKEAAEKRQKDLEDTVAKQTETLNMLTQLIASMQAQQMSLMNNQ